MVLTQNAFEFFLRFWITRPICMLLMTYLSLIVKIPFSAFYASSLYFFLHFRYTIFPKGPQWK